MPGAKPTKYSLQVLPSEMASNQVTGVRRRWNPERELPSPPFVPEDELKAVRTLPRLGPLIDDDTGDCPSEQHAPLDLIRERIQGRR